MKDTKTVYQLIHLVDVALDIIEPLDEQNYACLSEITGIKLKFQQIDAVLTNLKFQHVINFMDDKSDIKTCQKCLTSSTPQLSYCKKVPCKSFKDRDGKLIERIFDLSNTSKQGNASHKRKGKWLYGQQSHVFVIRQSSC